MIDVVVTKPPGRQVWVAYLSNEMVRYGDDTGSMTEWLVSRNSPRVEFIGATRYQVTSLDDEVLFKLRWL